MNRCALNRFWILIRRFHGDSITVYAVRGSIVSNFSIVSFASISSFFSTCNLEPRTSNLEFSI